MEVYLEDTECRIKPHVIQIDTLEELLEFMKEKNEMLILKPNYEADEDFCIEIYNGYRE